MGFCGTTPTGRILDRHFAPPLCDLFRGAFGLDTVRAPLLPANDSLKVVSHFFLFFGLRPRFTVIFNRFTRLISSGVQIYQLCPGILIRFGIGSKPASSHRKSVRVVTPTSFAACPVLKPFNAEIRCICFGGLSR